MYTKFDERVATWYIRLVCLMILLGVVIIVWKRYAEPQKQNTEQQAADRLFDTVQHPTLGTLKFPKYMPQKERDASVQRLLAKKHDEERDRADQQYIQVPDGTYRAFPSSMKDEEIIAILNKEFPKPTAWDNTRYAIKAWWWAWGFVITPVLLLLAEGLATLAFLFCAAYVIAKGIKRGRA